MSIDKNTAQHMAKLCALDLSDEELETMIPKLNSIMEMVETLSEVNTDNVEPLANVVNIDLKLRKDEVTDGDCTEKVLANAPSRTQDFFEVPKMVE